MPQFKKGDRIRCINATDNARKYLTHGEEYTAESDSTAFVRVKGDTGHIGSWATSRFELAAQAAGPVVLVWRDQTGEVFNATQFASEDAAREWAQENGREQDTYDIYDVAPRVSLKVSVVTTRSLVPA